jgi:hypothetical protein
VGYRRSTRTRCLDHDQDTGSTGISVSGRGGPGRYPSGYTRGR